MQGAPLMYVKNFWKYKVPRFLALGKPSIYISIVPYIDLSIYRGWQEVTEKPP